MTRMSDDLETWLRGEITGDLELARDAAQPPSSGKWKVDHRGCDSDCPVRCPKAGQCHDEHCECEEVTGDNIRIYNEGGHDAFQAEHIARHDPRDTIVRCEAELAILGEFESNEAEFTPDYWHGLWVAIRHIGAGYRHRPGYREDLWKP